MSCTPRTPAPTDEIVTVGWDGRSQPMLRFRDELRLPDHLRSIVALSPMETRALELCDSLVAAERETRIAIGEQQRLWHVDRDGRRSRGVRKAAAVRRRDRALDALITFVQGPDAPATVRSHFRIVGPTYYEAASAAVRSRRFAS